MVCDDEDGQDDLLRRMMVVLKMVVKTIAMEPRGDVCGENVDD